MYHFYVGGDNEDLIFKLSLCDFM